MYSFTVCDASKPIPMVNYPIFIRHKAVAKGVARSQIKRINHEDYVRMLNGGALKNWSIAALVLNYTSCA